MTTRNLDALFHPRAIALVGASNRPGSIGAVIARNLFEAGFEGPILTVNPKERAIRSSLNYASVADLPIAVDLAVVAAPPDSVPATIAQLGEKGCRAAVVLRAGYGPGEQIETPEQRQAMLDAARPYLLRVLGPNGLGFISTRPHINASIAHLMPAKGDVAFVSQSGAMTSAVLDWAHTRGFGFSHVVSLGESADVDFGDMLDYLALDNTTRAILLYVEHVKDARKFMSAGRIAARSKPVIVIKAGRGAAGARAALSHTGVLAGSDLVYDAAFRRAGMLRVHELRELFEAVSTLAAGIKLTGDRLAILTNGGGAGVVAVDAVEGIPGRLGILKPETVEALDKIIPVPWAGANPVDIVDDADGARYGAALKALLADKGSDAVLVLNCPSSVADSSQAADAVITVLETRMRAPVLTCWLGETAAAGARRRFAARRIPTYETPDEAVRAFGHLVSYQRNQTQLMETPPARTFEDPDRAKARELVEKVLGEGRSALTEVEAKAVLSAYDIPVVETRVAATPEDAGRCAAEIGWPVVVKVLSHDLTHKSDVGGVRLDLRSAAAVEDACRAIIASVAEKRPGASIAGFTVQAMVRRPNAQELIAGIAYDKTFGPVVLFGQGGTAVEVIGDRAVALPPLNGVLAREMIERTRVAKLLAGYRDHPPADMSAVAGTLVKLAELLADLPQIAELDINPLLADENGVIALDARIVVHETRVEGTDRFAIKPYPSSEVSELALTDGSKVALRPIRPEDEPSLVELVHRSDPQDVRMRFLGSVKDFPHLMAARLSQIDYDREMAFVAIEPNGDTCGVVRIISDPDNEAAEYAIMVRSDMKGKGLGYQLMTEILAHARKRGLNTVFGDVLRENGPMLHLAEDLGFKVTAGSDDPTVMRVVLDLSATPAAAGAGAGAGV
ncbi:bifunctional acetate--CoA ligase family protein/GNAT family N-acetyltransferase [Xanthobacter oligotrophicus]|uniref:bifunctional acetate--CoA ligase family protein/GNAT family N-acetyltransferase n=1 Tax=Xanthobacter oligotrophicus TaxID=2607286 RepID=UPI0011F20F89|nr:bifunctional acetate--CoA ligase family protein/GNAT family N-acetyltransferase [Xanthobacter oligotrophicus]MCG5237750.1 bifunctional acetate--CoA ligase family protein/GNAT family N-acetyltransferase [Xanthobacter oligotrophicus]